MSSDWMLMKTTVLVPSMCSHTNEGLLRNNMNPQVVDKKGASAPCRTICSGCYTIPVFPFSPFVRPCHSEEGVSLSASSGDEPTAGSSLRLPFGRLRTGAKQQLDQTERRALIVSTFL